MTERAATLLIVGLVTLVAARPAKAQDPLVLVNDSTQVRSVRFRFVDGHLFDAERLANEMVTRGPGFFERLRRRLAFLPLVSEPDLPFEPVELQRDMERLRRFYRRNGFLQPSIDYPVSQFDASSNRIGVIVTVREGPPLTVRNSEVRLVDPLPSAMHEGWDRMVGRLGIREGERYTEFERLAAEGRVLNWMRRRGYAFVNVAGSVAVDSVRFLADVELRVTPGPQATIDSVLVEGAESVSDRVILRQVPFGPGKRYDAGDLEDGQRALFGLNLFRVALVDVPPQPADSTVTVRIRVREAKARLLSTETGYSLENGLDMDATLRHRNFMGDARQLSFSVAYRPGWFARPPEGRSAVRTFSVTSSLQQPYIGIRKMSGSATVFYRWIDDPNQDTRYREIGVTPSLIYEFLPYRTAIVEFGASRAIPIRTAGPLSAIGVYDRSTFSSSVRLGKLNDYLHPRRGWLANPRVEVGGLLFGQLAYTKGTLDATGLIPITLHSSVVVTATVGRLVPRGASRDQTDPENEYRFDAIRYYAGGSSDVRGWDLQTLGPKFARADSIVTEAGGESRAVGAAYESVGGLGKISFSLELRMPAPGLGSSWQIGAFLDGGAIPARIRTDQGGRTLFDANGQPLVDDRPFPSPSDFRFGAGLGLRFLTPVGAVRLDAAWKLNPDDLDLQRPDDRVLFDAGILPDPPERRQMNRLKIHLSIDRVF
jgi:outer membrane protein insertion porin family